LYVYYFIPNLFIYLILINIIWLFIYKMFLHTDIEKKICYIA